MLKFILFFLFQVLEIKPQTSCTLSMCCYTAAPLVPLDAFLRSSPALDKVPRTSRGSVCDSVSRFPPSRCPCNSLKHSFVYLPPFLVSTPGFLLLSSPTETAVGGCEVTPSHSRPTSGLKTTAPNTVGENSTALERIYPETSPSSRQTTPTTFGPKSINSGCSGSEPSVDLAKTFRPGRALRVVRGNHVPAHRNGRESMVQNRHPDLQLQVSSSHPTRVRVLHAHVYAY